MTREIPVTQARSDLAELVNRVAYSGERVMLTRHGKPLAALVPVADLEALESPTEIGFAITPVEAADRNDRTDRTGRTDRSEPADRPPSPHTPMRIAARHQERPPGG